MLIKPMLLDETAQKILSAIQRIKNKLLGTSSAAVTPGSAGTSGTEPVIQDDTGRTIISALNDLGDAVPVETQYLSGVTGNIQTQLDGKKPKQTPVSDPTASGSGIEYISGITQNADGVLTATKSTVRNASASQSGLVSTGNQTFAGIKTFQANAITINANAQYPGFQFKSQNSTADRLGSLRFNFGGSTPNTAQAYIEERSLNSDGTPTNYFENYWLPIPTVGRTSNAGYNIITDKDPVTSSNLLGVPNFGGYGVALKAGDNVDTDLEMGHTYYSGGASISAALAGTPPVTNSGFKIMQIRSYAYANYTYQIAFPAEGRVYIRVRDGSGTWGVWGIFLDSRHTLTVAQGGTGATTAAGAKANLELGTSGMNFRVQSLTTANQQWQLKSNVVNSANSHYGNSTAIGVTNDGLSLYEWDSNNNYLGNIWTLRPLPVETAVTVTPAAGVTIYNNKSYRYGNIVVLNVRITTTSSIAASTAILSNLPQPQGASLGNTTALVACSAYHISVGGDVCFSITGAGNLIPAGSAAPAGTYVISAVYFAQ